MIPAFVNRWLKETSPGKIRNVGQPNQRVQDGPTAEWLCDACEQRFSDWERPFAEQIFRHVHTTTGRATPAAYRDWALKFAVSVSWRSLRFYREKDGLKHLSEEDLKCADEAEKVWRDFLLGRAPNPGKFEQHVLVVDALAQTSGPISPFLNRYFLRTVQSDVVASKSMCIVYTKLCRIVVIGFIRMQPSVRWRGTKLHVHSGTIGGNCEVPGILMKYWNDKADQAAEALASMSSRQMGKVDEVFANAGLRQARCFAR